MLIGITADIETIDGRRRHTSNPAYAEAITRAGGTPIVLTPSLGAIETYARSLAGFVFTGGGDPTMEPFGVPTHPMAERMDPERQDFELALLALLAEQHRSRPVLGICLGMQLMALHDGGTLDQHLPDVLTDAAVHRGTHGLTALDGLFAHDDASTGAVLSSHHQAVAHAGRLRVIARAPDGVIEAIDDPSRRFYVGVQWHPERTDEPRWGARLFDELVRAARDELTASGSAATR